jgi:hypothetical protein
MPTCTSRRQTLSIMALSLVNSDAEYHYPHGGSAGIRTASRFQRAAARAAGTGNPQRKQPPGEAHSGLDSAVKIEVESPFHRNEQQSQNRQADLP